MAQPTCLATYLNTARTPNPCQLPLLQGQRAAAPSANETGDRAHRTPLHSSNLTNSLCTKNWAGAACASRAPPHWNGAGVGTSLEAGKSLMGPRVVGG